ncbi:ChbG/HpnK family deacetylase [Actinoplanes sp. NPDC051861]|uniref:ChbG/HpnK family deacetylase n=1 Tax=Actinoplanes sp. NPDC051861 TaxID=3155170 RepID=UPI003448C087
MSRTLIVNADDYGLTEGISRGILHAHRAGVVSSTSVLAVGPAVGVTGPWLHDSPDLGTGAHLALVGEDPPLLSRTEIPTLVDRAGRFPLSWRVFLARAAAGRVDPADVEREFTAQVERLTRDLGLRLSHLDTHQHLHLWPPVAAVLVRLARRHAVGATRVPSSRSRGPRGAGVRMLSRRLRTVVDRAGLAAPSAYAGLDEAGRFTLPRLLQAIDLLAGLHADKLEVNCHPGEAGDPDRARYAWGFRWSAELDALTHPATRDAISRHGLRLAGFSELAPTGQR